eukprot:GHVN01056944.1.p1 GENE.GHVN01056944.1~~GHVN01056944.1.p1  ORF type:complete len:313 (-),score=23.11 GHVN01056944.1:2381-3319(-)
MHLTPSLHKQQIRQEGRRRKGKSSNGAFGYSSGYPSDAIITTSSDAEDEGSTIPQQCSTKLNSRCFNSRTSMMKNPSPLSETSPLKSCGSMERQQRGYPSPQTNNRQPNRRCASLRAPSPPRFDARMPSTATLPSPWSQPKYKASPSPCLVPLPTFVLTQSLSNKTEGPSNEHRVYTDLLKAKSLVGCLHRDNEASDFLSSGRKRQSACSATTVDTLTPRDLADVDSLCSASMKSWTSKDNQTSTADLPSDSGGSEDVINQSHLSERLDRSFTEVMREFVGCSVIDAMHCRPDKVPCLEMEANLKRMLWGTL